MEAIVEVIEEAIEGVMEGVLGAGEVDVAEAQHSPGVIEEVVGAVPTGTVGAVPDPLGRLDVSQRGGENLGNFQNQVQTRGQTHIPQEWGFHPTAGAWSRWSRAIGNLLIDNGGSSAAGEVVKEEVRADSGSLPEVIELRGK